MDKLSYFKKRISRELEIPDEQNTIRLKNENGQTFEAKIFTEDSKGNIQILLYTLNRETIEYDHPKATLDKPNIYNDRNQTYKITRLHPDNVKEGRKYLIPKGAGTYPFIPPNLLGKYEKKEKIKTLILTEGAFKAFKGDMHGLDVVGLSSITHYKDKKTKQLHSDIIDIIKTCNVQNIVMLYDGDCMDISLNALKEGEDLYKRPYGFFASAIAINDLVKDFDVSFYFSHINSRVITGNPKGLDDLLIASKGKEKEIIDDIISFSNKGKYCFKINMSGNLNKLKRYFGFKDVNTFYGNHSEYIKEEVFNCRGTKYKYNEYEDKVEVVMPAAAENYFRVGNDYYERFQRPNKHGTLETIVSPILKSTITDDYGRKILKYIQKYKAFVNVPSHKEFQSEIHSCYNSYSPFTHKPIAGDYRYTESFLKHIFGEQYEMGLDYIQLLYLSPNQKLPILCLVSKENSTGKSTYPKWLQKMFSQNVTIIGNAEISSEFNAHLASKLVIAIDEGFIEKKVIVEKIKYLATADTMPMNRKGKDIVDVDFFAKIIILSNNVDNFITANKEDIRYWVRELKSINKENPDILNHLEAEIPAFLHFLEGRKLSTKKESRSWFHPDMIKTEAFKKVVEASKPGIVREIETNITEMFFEFETKEIFLALKDIKELFFSKSFHVSGSYIKKTLSEHFPFVQRAKTIEGNEGAVRYKIPYWEERHSGSSIEKHLAFSNQTGRPFVFKAKEFLNETELKNLSITATQ